MKKVAHRVWLAFRQFGPQKDLNGIKEAILILAKLAGMSH